ncbi:vanillate monooxygenase [Burkholderia sp. YI23]|nr:vanillate monooxygenase [Burkholderia sp. YI23]
MTSSRRRIMSFLKNAWYVGAWASEVTRALTPRTILNEAVLFYRKTDGSAAAIGGICPHRFAPLSMGKLVGDEVQCGYHGLQFDCSGKCTGTPIDKKVPAAAKVKSWPLVEKYNLIWLWMGEPERADESLIPDFSYLLDSNRKILSGVTHVKANYELIVDNLADLTHTHFLHGNFLHTEAVKQTQHQVMQEGTTVHSKFWFPDGRVPPLMGKYMDDPELIVDRWTEIRWDAPATIRLNAGATPTGKPREEGIQAYGTHLLTPETEHSTHYFYAHARSFKIDDPATDVLVREWQQVAFNEQDKPMIEAQQKIIGERELMDMRPVLLATDAGAVRIRRVIRKLIQEEQAPVPAQ